MKTWIVGILLCVLGGANAGLVFRLLDSRFVAALIAGSGFVLVGLYLIALVWSHEKPWIWVTFFTSHIHLVFISIPMLWVRMSVPDIPFSELTVFGLAGTEFHAYSTYFYQLMLLGLVIDSVRYYYFKKMGESKGAAENSEQ